MINNKLEKSYQKTSHRTRHTRDTFPKEGIDAIRAFTDSLMPSHREMALRGLKALSARMAFNPPIPAFARIRLTIEI